jgi:transposase
MFRERLARPVPNPVPFRPVRYLGRTGRRWPDAVKGPWQVTFHWAEIDSRAECVGIDLRGFRTSEESDLQGLRAVHGAGDGAPVAATLPRRVPLARLMREAREDQREIAKALAAGLLKVPTGSKSRIRRETARQIPAFEAERRPGRPRRLDDEHFREVAEVYRAAFSTAPTKHVAQHFFTSRSAAAKWVARAREMGLLENPPERRRAIGRKPVPNRPARATKQGAKR